MEYSGLGCLGASAVGAGQVQMAWVHLKKLAWGETWFSVRKVPGKCDSPEPKAISGPGEWNLIELKNQGPGNTGPEFPTWGIRDVRTP